MDDMAQNNMQETVTPSSEVQPITDADRKRRRKKIIIVCSIVAVVLAAIIAGYFWWKQMRAHKVYTEAEVFQMLLEREAINPTEDEIAAFEASLQEDARLYENSEATPEEQEAFTQLLEAYSQQQVESSEPQPAS